MTLTTDLLMSQHPVQLRLQRPATMGRVHVLIRLVLLAALGTIGCGSIYWMAYLAVPALAALAISRSGGKAFLSETSGRATRALTWLAGAYAYLWMLTDAPPGRDGPVELRLQTSGEPTIGSALLRLLYSLPALLVLLVLSIAASLLWCVAALVILVRARPSVILGDFFALTLRYQFRLIAYHASLVERYPTMEETSLDPIVPSAQRA